MSGKVYLLGAGPGDPELLTMKGARILRQAQAVVYDYLANPQLLDLVPDTAQKIYAGKKEGRHTMSQETINSLLCDLGNQGLRVARLKGGDPMLFGRGGEEASALADAGVDFEIVPGVSSALAGPAYAGIPVTDRRYGSAVALVTGHEDPHKGVSALNWEALAQLPTVIFLMGVKFMTDICRNLMAAGKSEDTPAAAIHGATTARQRALCATLATLPEKSAAAGLTAPSVIVVGEVVNLRERLAWYEHLPLFGRRVLVTRVREQAASLSMALREQGADVLEIPTIELIPPPDREPLKSALNNLADYQWMIFTSANAVRAFFPALQEQGRDSRALASAKIAAIGPATAAALNRHGLRPDLVPRTFTAEGLLEALADYDLRGNRVLLPRALEARELLPRTLMERGALVDVAPVYRTTAPLQERELLSQAIREGFDILTFTAASTAHNFWTMLEAEERARILQWNREGRLAVAAIGPLTAQAARELGLVVGIMPQEHTIPSLTAALAGYYSCV